MAVDSNFTFKATLQDITKEFVAAIYDPSTSPMTLISSQVITKDATPPYYAVPFQVLFTNLVEGKGYYVALLESPDGTATGTTNISVNFVADGSSITARSSLHIYGGVTAGFNVGDSGYTDTSLVGWTYDINQWNAGILDPNDAINGVTINPAGGWAWNSSQTITLNDHYVHVFQAKITPAVMPQPALISSLLTITNTTVMDNTYVNKAIVVNSSVPWHRNTFPALSTVSDFDVLWIYMQGNTGINVSFICSGSDQIMMDILRSKIVLGQNEILKMFKVTISGQSYWYIDFLSPSYFNVGKPFFSSTSTVMNAVPWSGETINRVIYERMTDWINSNITTVTDTAWTTTVDGSGNYTMKGKYSSGDGSTTWRTPLASNAGLIRGINGDGSRTPGDFQDWQALQLYHLTASGSSGTSLFGRGPSNLLLKLFGSSTTTNLPDLTSGIVDVNGNPISRSGTSVRDKSSGAFIMVNI